MLRFAPVAASQPVDALSEDRGIYIAYPRGAQAYAEALYAHLKTLRWDPFLDVVDLQVGDDWTARLPAEQARCVATVVLITDTSSQSPYVRDEVTRAIELSKAALGKAHLLIPLPIAAGVTVDSYPFGLKSVQALDLPANAVVAAEAITTRLAAHLAVGVRPISARRILQRRSLLIAASPLALLALSLLSVLVADVAFRALPEPGETEPTINLNVAYGHWYASGILCLAVIGLIGVALRFALRSRSLAPADGIAAAAFAALAPFSLLNMVNADNLAPRWVQAVLDGVQIPLGLTVITYLVSLQGRSWFQRIVSFFAAALVAVFWVTTPAAFLAAWLAGSGFFDWYGTSSPVLKVVFDPGAMGLLGIALTAVVWHRRNRRMALLTIVPR